MTNERKNLLLLPWEYPYRPGEAPFIEPELAALSEKFNVRIAACLNDGTPTDNPVPCPVPFAPAGKASAFSGVLDVLTDGDFWREFFTIFKGAKGKLPRRLGFLFYNYLHAHRFARSLERNLLPSFRPDVVYSFWGRETAYTARLLKKRLPGVKIASRFHRFDLYENRSPLGFLPFRPALNRALDAFLFISNEGRSYYRAKNPLAPQEKMHTLYLGCTPSPCRANPDFGRFVIVSCSRVMPEKRLRLLVDALSRVEGVNIDWHHMGGGENLDALKAYAALRLGEKSNVNSVFHGTLENSALRPLYRALGARLLVNVSSSEGLPVTMMEAFSMGLPALGTDVGGVSEIVTEKTGVLLDADPSPEAIAAALIAFSKRPKADWLLLSEAAGALWAESFNSERNAARTASFLAGL